VIIMQALFALVLIYAVWQALTKGVPAGLRAARDFGRNRMSAWRSENPDASTPAVLGQRLATWAAGLRYGPGFVKREMSGAFKDGWEDAKRRWALVKEDQDPDDHIENEPEPPKPAPAPEPIPGRRPILRPVPTQKEGKPTMPIKTATGGEITTPETLLAEVQAIRDEALAEREDAIGDAARADEDLARIDRMVASLGQIRMRQEDIAKITVMRDSAAARKAAAGARAAAADLRVAQSNSAVDTAAQHIQLMGQAAGSFYGN
jgi:hypothetical protein